MKGKLTYQYVNQNPKGGNFAAKWHPVKATAVLASPGMSSLGAKRRQSRRGRAAKRARRRRKSW